MSSRRLKGKFLTTCFAAWTASALLAGCSSPGTADSGTAGAPPVTLRFGHIYGATHHYSVAANDLASQVEKATDGRVKIQVFPAGQLGTEAEMNEALLDGSLDMRIGTPPGEARPELQILSAPYLFDTAEGAVQALRSETAEELVWKPMNEQLRISSLDIWYLGDNYITSNKKFTDPESAAGVLLRVPPIDALLDVGRALGTEPLPLPFNELYTALQTGVVDAQMSPTSAMHAAKLYEVQEYLLPVKINNTALPLLISDAAMAKVSKEDQKTLKSIARDVGDKVLADGMKNDADLLEKLGTEMTVLDVDNNAFRKAVEEKFLPKYDAIYGKGVYHALQKSTK